MKVFMARTESEKHPSPGCLSNLNFSEEAFSYSSENEEGSQIMADTTTIIPDPLRSDREYCRYHHIDLADLDDTQLRDELNALRPLLWGLDKDDWLRQRVAALETEIAKRKYSGKQQAIAKPKPKQHAVEGVKL
jgi:hypothetical protein